MRSIKTWATALGGSLLAVLLLVGVACAQDYPEPAEPSLTPCATEDSDNCYWDADTMGNKRGNDSVVIPEELP